MNPSQAVIVVRTSSDLDSNTTWSDCDSDDDDLGPENDDDDDNLYSSF
jgi:hypothetical protein